MTSSHLEIFGGPACQADSDPIPPRVRKLRNQIAGAERVIQQASEELARLEAFPAEADFLSGDPDVPVVIWFNKQFTAGGKVYEYAAIRCAENGLWYTTGPNSTRGYSWGEFMAFIAEGVTEIWVANEWGHVI